MIEIDKIREDYTQEMNEAYRIVKQKENLILKTEMMMQETSLYSDNYKPLFIYEMDEESIKDFSKLLNQKLRHVKLAISKANLGQNKYKSENETSQNNEGPLNERSKNIKKHILDPKMFNTKTELKYFSFDSYGKKIMKKYQEILNEKLSIEQEEQKLSKIKENLEERRQLLDRVASLSYELDSLKIEIDSNFNNEHFKPSASRNTVLPPIKNEDIKLKKERIKNSMASLKINSKYKSKDKMTVREMFDFYKGECSDFMVSLINPFSKLSKYIKKDNSNTLKTLLKMQNMDSLNYDYDDSILSPQSIINNQNQNQGNFNINLQLALQNSQSKNPKVSTSKYSEDMYEFSSPKK